MELSAEIRTVIFELLASRKIKTIDHPPYSPDLAPCDFWLFSGHKRSLRGNRYSTKDEVEEAANEYFRSLKKEDWLGAFQMWQDRMERCIAINGDYNE